MTSTQSMSVSASSRLLQTLAEYDRVTVVMHDNPDPDAIASGWGVKVLIDETLRLPTRVIGGGAIVRAENSYMVDLLDPPIELIDDLEIDDRTATILVDCSVAASNHLLTRHKITPVAIIDHHKNGNGHDQIPFVDIRPDVAASATITASYLKEQGIDLGTKLATAMLYAVQTETCAYESHYSALDRSILPWLMELGDPELLAEIENAPLKQSYFGDLLLALQNTFLYDDVAICFLPRADGAEIVGEVADMLIRCEVITRVLCGAEVDSDFLVSARTQHKSDDALKLIQATVGQLGGAGGHAHRAGGKIPGVGAGSMSVDDVCEQLRGRWLEACKVTRKRGTRLIAKREIVQNLDR